MRRIWGAFGGLIVFSILWAIVRDVLGWGLTAWPLSALIIDMLPGIIVGVVAGVSFPKVFGFFADFFTDW